MPYTYNKLRGRIVEKFGSISAFSKALGILPQATSRKLHGKAAFTIDDIEKWSKLLDISREEYGLYYFA